MALCKLSGEIMEDPVHVNGEHYDRDALIDYLQNGDGWYPQLNEFTINQVN